MMASLSEFFKIPTVGFVNTCKKEELLEIADHYSMQYEQERLRREARIEQEKSQREERLELERIKQKY